MYDIKNKRNYILATSSQHLYQMGTKSSWSPFHKELPIKIENRNEQVGKIG